MYDQIQYVFKTSRTGIESLLIWKNHSTVLIQHKQQKKGEDEENKLGYNHVTETSSKNYH